MMGHVFRSSDYKMAEQAYTFQLKESSEITITINIRLMRSQILTLLLFEGAVSAWASSAATSLFTGLHTHAQLTFCSGCAAYCTLVTSKAAANKCRLSAQSPSKQLIDISSQVSPPRSDSDSLSQKYTRIYNFIDMLA